MRSPDAIYLGPTSGPAWKPALCAVARGAEIGAASRPARPGCAFGSRGPHGRDDEALSRAADAARQLKRPTHGEPSCLRCRAASTFSRFSRFRAIEA